MTGRGLAYVLLMMLWAQGVGQQIVTPMTRDLIPPNPEAAAIQKVQLPEPSLLTGAADFAIPLFNVPVGDVSVPFTLRYHSNGIKVADDPAPVGYGWTLQPALRATRTVLGRPDEMFPFMTGLEQDTRYRCYECMMSPNIQSPNYSPHDSEHDIFTFSLPEATIVRMLDCTEGHPTFIGGVDQEYTVESTANLDTIDVYSPLGVKYSFYGLCEYQPVNYSSPGSVRTAWPLAKITAPTGQSATIGWANPAVTRSPQYLAGVSFFDSWDPILWDGSNIAEDEMTYDNAETANFAAYPGCPYMLTPSSVIFEGGKVALTYSFHNGSPFLKRIEVKDTQDAVVKTATLAYDDYSCLSSVSLSDAGDFTFDYIQRPRTSFRQHSQDWWGYYNGKENTSLTPKVKIRRFKENSNAGQMLEYGDADRSVDSVAMQDHMLRRVVYPTGGTVDFEYEVHRFAPMRSGGGTAHDLADETNPLLDHGGGLRVKSITMSDGDTPLKVNYNYDSIHVRAVPSMATFISITRAMLPLRGYNTLFHDMGELRSVVISGESNYMRYDIGQTPIWYGKVTAVYPEGKIEYIHKDIIQQNEIYTDYGVRTHLGLNKVFDPGVRLVRKTVYEGTPGSYAPVQTERWDYTAATSGVSGSTMIQRLIIQASDNFTCPDFYEAEYMGSSSREKVDGQIYQPWSYGVVPTVARLIGKSSTMHTVTGDFTTSESYSYVGRTGLVKSTVKTTSDGTGETLTTEYAVEGTDDTSLAMVAAHSPGLPLKETLSHGTASTALTARYSPVGQNGFKIARTATCYGTGPELLSARVNYGAHGRPTSIEDADGIATVFEWSRNGLYLQKITEGLPTLALSADNGQDRISAGDPGIEDNIGITTQYTHKQLVGVSSVRNPWGTETDYSYDSANRLSGISSGGTALARFAYRLGAGDNAVVSNLHFDDGRVHSSETRFDGLGREVAQEDKTTGISAYTRYDGMGRPSAVSRPLSDAPGEYDWTLTSYEASPRAVEIESIKAGQLWQQADKSVRSSIFTNTAGGQYPCPNLIVNSSGTLTHRGNYPAGRLLVRETVDEDGYTTREFTDMGGRVLMTSAGSDGEFLTTRYVYDDYGRLRAVLPPNITGSIPQPYTQEFRDKAFEYKYDKYGRLASAHTPGAGTVSYRYSPAGRLMARNTPAMASGQWELFLYDRAGRRCVNYLAAATSAQLDSMNATFRPVEYTGSGPLGGYQASHTLLSAPQALLRVDYYDNHRFLGLYPKAAQTSLSGNYLRGLLSGSVDMASDTIINVFGYDRFGRECTRVTVWPDATERTERRFDLQGNVLEETNSYSPALGRAINRTTAREYDAAGRLVRSAVAEGARTAALEYAYGSDGRLASVKYPGEVTADFGYDCHGWLTSHKVTKPVKAVGGGEPALPLSAQYYTSLTPVFPGVIPEQVSETLLDEAVYYHDGRTPLFNGCPSGHSIAPSGRYDFSFDKFNRLVGADYTPATGESADADFSTEYSYDVVANPLKLKRYGIVDVGADGSESFGLLDELKYSYGGGNRVAKIARGGEGPDYYGRPGFPCVEAAQYTWNKAGALTADPARGIDRISYNVRGLTDTIAYADGTLQVWRHSSDSLLLGITTIEPGGKLRHASLRHYRGNRIFVDRGLEYSAFEGGYFDARGAAHYYHTDYRGDIVMVTDSTGAVTQRTSYYPYGEPHRLPEGQPYLFAAKERHSRTGATLFGPRNLLTAALLWTAPDALAGQNKSGSPWAYCNANPVLFIDPTGKKLEMAKDLKEFDVMSILDQLQLLTDDELTLSLLADGNISINIERYNSGQRTVGTQLLRNIIKHPSRVLIDFLNSVGSNMPESKRVRSLAYNSGIPTLLSQKGVKSIVNFNYSKEIDTWVQNDLGKTVKESTPLFIILAHELIHSLHHIKGSNIDRAKRIESPLFKNSIKIEESTTVGLTGNLPITENAIRRENGIPLRVEY